ncbi:hypothetical protein [Pelosinus sp. UFO1]|uniref:hypothetical protein n=1 Tax=Pelosinus sp. UFO1 TaxID=484770 RepID=UPI0004D1A609|nr:hypothetical protein [Pelosinus sp. UFO1]AIF51227.1 hypothetical protein UFO1_1676 [Pelosinus sp. UFO1]
MLKLLYIVWFLCTPIFYVGISLWLFINRNESMRGNKKLMRIPSANTLPIFGYHKTAEPAPIFQTKTFRAISLFLAVAFVFLMIEVSIPYIKDIPVLITGNYEYIEGTPQKIWHKSKSFTEYVQINGLNIEFPFTSTMKEGKNYRVKYLPNSRSGLSVEQLPMKNNLI